MQHLFGHSTRKQRLFWAGLLILLSLLLGANASLATCEILTCGPYSPGGDLYDRGFYMPSFPGLRMDTVR